MNDGVEVEADSERARGDWPLFLEPMLRGLVSENPELEEDWFFKNPPPLGVEAELLANRFALPARFPIVSPPSSSSSSSPSLLSSDDESGATSGPPNATVYLLWARGVGEACDGELYRGL